MASINLKFLNRKNLEIGFLWWLGLAAILWLFHFTHDLNSDEGIILNGAWNLINQRALYYDFFEYMPPGSFYLVFWVWKIFGVSYAAAKIVSVFFIFLGAVGVYKTGRLISGMSAVYFAPLAFVLASTFWPLINHNAHSTITAVWAVYFFIFALRGSWRWPYFFSGFLSGLTILFLQQKGIALAAAELFFLIILIFKDRSGRIAQNALALFAGVFLPLILIFLKWPPSLLYENLILYPLKNYTRGGIIEAPFFLLFLLAGLIFIVWTIRREVNRGLAALALIQACLLFAALINPDAVHVMMSSFVFFIFWPLAWDKIKLGTIRQKYTLSFVYSVIVLVIAETFIVGLFYLPPFYSIKEMPAIGFIKDNCQASDYIYAGPFLPGMYFETRKLNPTPYHILLSTFQTEEQFMAARRMLEERSPACAVLNYELTKKWSHDLNNPVDGYIRDNCEPVFRDGNKIVCKFKGK